MYLLDIMKNSKYIFDNINLRILKNNFIGIQGKSGSGKTTLVNLILGLLKPTKGKILLNEKLKILTILKSHHSKWVMSLKKFF